VSDRSLTQEEWEKPAGAGMNLGSKRPASEIVEMRAFALPSKFAADVRGRPPMFTVAYSPKTPQKWAGKKRYRRKYLKSLALPRGIEPLFSP
jgi:hypothetical protein